MPTAAIVILGLAISANGTRLLPHLARWHDVYNTLGIMTRSPPLLELLWVAALGARGWFTTVALIGLALFLVRFGLNPEAEPRVVVFAFFMPLLLAAIMGTVALGSHRARSETWEGGSLRRPVYVTAFIWNAGFGLASLFIDRVVLYFRQLPREPFAFPQSLVVVVAMAAVLALLAVYPRHGPQ